MKRRAFAAGAAGALALGSAARAQVPGIYPLPTPLNSFPQIPTGPPFNFAVAVPLSGEQRPFGIQVVNGAQQAVYDANQTRVPTDPIFTIRTFDDQGSIAGASLQAQFIIDDTTINAVIGHLGGRITDLVVPRYGGALVPHIVPVATYDPITSHGYRTIFRLPTKDATEGQLYAQTLDKRAKPSTVVVVADQGDAGPDVASAFVAQATTDKVLVNRIDVSSSKPDDLGAATRALAAKPDFVFFAGQVRELGGVLDQLRVGGYTGSVGASQGFFDPATISRFGKAVEGLVASSSIPPLNLDQDASQARANFQQQYGVMTPLAAFGYASAQLLVTLVRRTAATNRLALARALNSPLPNQTIVGTYTFGPTGDPINPQIYFYTVKGGTWEYSYAANPTAFLLK